MLHSVYYHIMLYYFNVKSTFNEHISHEQRQVPTIISNSDQIHGSVLPSNRYSIRNLINYRQTSTDKNIIIFMRESAVG